MSSLFQGFTNASGQVLSTTAAPGSSTVIYRGIAIDGATKAVHVSTTAAIDVYIGGIPVTNAGVVCVTETPAAPGDDIPGGLVEIGGRLYSGIADPNLIHQGVGLRTGGRLCRVAV